MTVNAKWDNPEQNRVILSFQHPWTWIEFEAANAQLDQLFRSASQRVDLILDITEGGFPPGNAIPHFKRVSEKRHPNLGQIAVVGLPGFFRGTLNVIQSVYRGHYQSPDFLFFRTLEKARDGLTHPVSNPLSNPPR